MHAVSTKELGCVKSASELLGDKWTPQLLRFFLNNEVVRFCQLQEMVGGINPRTLSSRLLSLEKSGIITKLPLGPSSRCEYAVTDKGRALLPILRSMEEWSKSYDC